MDTIKRLIYLLLISLVPSLVYYGYSFTLLGTLATSGTCRAFALQERASSLGGFPYSTATVRFFLTSSMIMPLCLSLWGLGELNSQRETKSFVGFSVASVAIYVILLSLIVPVTRGLERYVLPAVPFVAIPTSVAAGKLWASITGQGRRLFATFFVVALILMPMYEIARRCLEDSKRGLSFDVIVEKDIVDYMNRFVKKDGTVLVYEVQDRYYLRPDISLLSLDGITDGKVAPYLRNRDMYSFLLKYRPDYWLAGDCVHYRPYLSGSMLAKVVDETGDGDKAAIRIGEIKFTRIRAWSQPLVRGFGAYRQLYRVEYAQ